MNQQNRVGVIEVGSRAVRLLVTDVRPDATLQVVGTDWKETGLATVVNAPEAEIQARVADLVDTVTRFRTRAHEMNATRLAAFGTWAVRKLGAPHLAALRKAAPEFRVLSGKEEAELSLFAGVMGTAAQPLRAATYLVVDQGSGSMEVVVGEAKDGGLHVADHRSYKLGTRELVQLLRRGQGRPSRLRSALKTRFAGYSGIAPGTPGLPIVLGSAATKLAWLGVRKDPFAPYDPRKVHGRSIPLSQVDSLVRVAEGDPATARTVIDPKNPGSDEFEVVIAGLVGLEVFLRGQGKEDFVVCGHGTRYGLAWKLALANGAQA